MNLKLLEYNQIVSAISVAIFEVDFDEIDDNSLYNRIIDEIDKVIEVV